jgi:hypothetical protein
MPRRSESEMPMTAITAQQPEASASGVAKSGTWEDLVGSEMRKGCNAEVAAQRVAQQHGFPALHNRRIAKAEATADDFQKEAEFVAERDGISRTAALRKLRLENPHYFAQMR